MKCLFVAYIDVILNNVFSLYFDILKYPPYSRCRNFFFQYQKETKSVIVDFRSNKLMLIILKIKVAVMHKNVVTNM